MINKWLANSIIVKCVNSTITLAMRLGVFRLIEQKAFHRTNLITQRFIVRSHIRLANKPLAGSASKHGVHRGPTVIIVWVRLVARVDVALGNVTVASVGIALETVLSTASISGDYYCKWMKTHMTEVIWGNVWFELTIRGASWDKNAWTRIVRMSLYIHILPAHDRLMNGWNVLSDPWALRVQQELRFSCLTDQILY